ncbi:hypothetical protein [Falsiroseomonas stagni]|uniref:hypothetical protein n=1 Tax=Falsiroseomonas stagni TaxID=484882 RepID=UPI001113A9A3|nr:hypothetical protein [Falsiroseomonas stagni]
MLWRQDATDTPPYHGKRKGMGLAQAGLLLGPAMHIEEARLDCRIIERTAGTADLATVHGKGP